MLNDPEHLRTILHGCVRVGINSSKNTEKPARELYKSSSAYKKIELLRQTVENKANKSIKKYEGLG